MADGITGEHASAKKLTGAKAIQRRFPTNGEAVQWANGFIEERKKHGTEVFSLSQSAILDIAAPDPWSFGNSN